MEFSFDEIKNGSHFESLVAEYFKEILKDDLSATVKQTGIGTDEGVDVLIEFTIKDKVTTFKRKWIIQCKFHEKDVSPREIADVNIPSLIHSHRASGYLLIVKRNPTSKLTKSFEKLSSECRFDFKYEIWTGETFKNLILNLDSHTIIQQFFPKYYEENIKPINKKIK